MQLKHTKAKKMRNSIYLDDTRMLNKAASLGLGEWEKDIHGNTKFNWIVDKNSVHGKFFMNENKKVEFTWVKKKKQD